MGYEYVQLVQETNNRRKKIANYKANRKATILRKAVVSISALLVFIMLVCISNIDLIKADAAAGKMLSFRVDYAVTEDYGLTLVTTDGNVWDVDPVGAQIFEDGTHVEITFNDMGTADVTDDEIIKIRKVK